MNLSESISSEIKNIIQYHSRVRI